MNIGELIKRVIPPKDYQHRNGFSNIQLIDSLETDSRRRLERALVRKLIVESQRDVDPLLVDTLAHLKSIEAVPILRDLLDSCTDTRLRIVLATAVFTISGDEQMIRVVLQLASEIASQDGPYQASALTSVFYYLTQFRKAETTRFVEGFVNSEDHLIAYNAHRALQLGE